MINFLKKYFSYIILIFILSSYFFFGLQHLGKFITADEHYWIYERIPQYWDAIADKKWEKTFINDKPGVSIALVSGIGLLVTPHPETLCSRTPERVITCDTVQIEKMLFVFRFPLLLINALFILYLFWIIKKMTNQCVALLSTCFIAFSPILIGISQIINPDTLLWSFGASALFSYLVALKHNERKYIFFAGFFLGFALLSKYTASILIPFFLTTSIFSVLFSVPILDQTYMQKQTKNNLIVFFLTFFIATITVIFFLPAIWFKPTIFLHLLSGGSETPFIIASFLLFTLFFIDAVIFKSRFFFLFYKFVQKIKILNSLYYILPWSMILLFISLIVGRTVFPNWDLFTIIPFDTRDLTSTYNGHDITPNFFESFLLEMNPLTFSLPPIILFFFLVLLFQIPFLKKMKTSWQPEILIIFFFILIFLPLLIFLDVLAIPRYIILLYPLVAFLSACGMWEGKQYIKKKWHLKTFSIRFQNLIIFIIPFLMISIITIRPFYFNYTNIFLPKESLISDAWGYGGYEAAQYLNTLPNAENLLVWSDYEGVCEFFKGKCMIKQYKYSSKQKIDYAIITRRGEILYNPNHSRWMKEGNLSMKQAYDNPNPAWQLNIDNRSGNFIKIVKIK